MTTSPPTIVIVELGSQFTLLIERTLREMGFRSALLPPEKCMRYIAQNDVCAVILSGGEHSVTDEHAPRVPEELFTHLRRDCTPLPVLGICYGMQYIAHHFGGTLGKWPEYSETRITVVTPEHPMVAGIPTTSTTWMSHGDAVVEMPSGFVEVARSEHDCLAAIARDHIWAVQFHPEVTHTEYGKEMLAAFLASAGARHDWVPTDAIAAIRETMSSWGDDARAIFGFSGGVDSTTLAALAAPVFGDRLDCVVIDGGQLREGEREEIQRHADAAGVRARFIDVREEMLAALAGLTDAEAKRKAFKAVYSSTFQREALTSGATIILQGTLAPDRIESGATGGAVIKSHHNVGLDTGVLEQKHPIDHLFKYEVRALAEALRLPESVHARQPFPGPGLVIRIVGTPVTDETLSIVRWADKAVRDILVRRDIYRTVSQLVVAYIGVPTVAVKGDGRAYTGAVVVRAVRTTDFMTAEGVCFDPEVQREIASVITRHPKVARAWFDPTDKPPATTEME